MLSVVIPVGLDDRAWRALLTDLVLLNADDEIVLVAARSDDIPSTDDIPPELKAPTRWIVDWPGRARQLNAGARQSTQAWLWFLHADTRVPTPAIEAAQRCASTNARMLGYFDLAFSDDGPSLMRINAFGVWLRCRLFQLPFGDQGFLLSRELFDRLGPYDEALACGEDHALVWAAHHAGVPVCSLGTTIRTSARKYADQGWARTTFAHLCLTWKQAKAQLAQGRGVRC